MPVFLDVYLLRILLGWTVSASVPPGKLPSSLRRGCPIPPVFGVWVSSTGPGCSKLQLKRAEAGGSEFLVISHTGHQVAALTQDSLVGAGVHPVRKPGCRPFMYDSYRSAVYTLKKCLSLCVRPRIAHQRAVKQKNDPVSVCLGHLQIPSRWESGRQHRSLGAQKHSAHNRCKRRVREVGGFGAEDVKESSPFAVMPLSSVVSPRFTCNV